MIARTEAYFFVQRLARNVDDWYAGRIAHETFRVRQALAWDEIVADPIVYGSVLDIIRDHPNAVLPNHEVTR